MPAGAFPECEAALRGAVWWYGMVLPGYVTRWYVTRVCDITRVDSSIRLSAAGDILGTAYSGVVFVAEFLTTGVGPSGVCVFGGSVLMYLLLSSAFMVRAALVMSGHARQQRIQTRPRMKPHDNNVDVMTAYT